jgi:hypothetical protein
MCQSSFQVSQTLSETQDTLVASIHVLAGRKSALLRRGLRCDLSADFSQESMENRVNLPDDDPPIVCLSISTTKHTTSRP